MNNVLEKIKFNKKIFKTGIRKMEKLNLIIIALIVIIIVCIVSAWIIL